MRVAYVTESFPPDLNGVAHTAMRVAEHLASRGHQPLVIAPEPPAGKERPDASLGFPVFRVPSVAIPMYRDLRIGLPGVRVRDEIAAFKADIVHLAGPVVLGAAGLAAARKLDLPTVAVYATDMPAYAGSAYRMGDPGRAAAWWWMRRLHNACDRTLAPSTDTKRDLVEHGIDRVHVWSRGVDTVRFDPAKRDAALRAELAPRGELIAGYIGRLAAEKKLDLLCEIAAKPDVRLVIVGGGSAEAGVRKAMPQALFLGRRDGEELARIYASLDVFVHSGPHETFGNTLQEAAASGVPVVAPASGGPLDLVADGRTGFLVPPYDASALANAVSKLCAEPELRADMGRAARTAMLARSWPVLGDELIDHYCQVLEASGKAGAAAKVPA